MKINKKRLLLELIILIGLLIYGTKTIIIPNYYKMFGSSDKFINTTKYKSLVEFKIGETNFGIVIDNKKEVYHLLYFDKTSTCLYNQNIENNNIDIVSNQIIRILINNNLLKNDTKIILTKYEDDYFNDVKNSFTKYLEKYQLDNKIIEENNDLINKAKTISSEKIDSNSYALIVLDLYSKELVDQGKDTIITEELTETNSKTYINNIYKKIENYMESNNINDLEKNNDKLDITTIPGDKNGNYYPTNNSYYYIKSRKVYAYIEIKDLNNTYSYCYNGSIDDYIKGECQ